MTQAAKRSLRTRKTPAYLLPDDMDHQEAPASRQLYPKEYVSPAQELNSAAKLFAKFVNSVNKSYRLSMSCDETKEKVCQQIPQPQLLKNQNKSQMISQVPNKRVTTKQQMKEDITKQPKKKSNEQSNFTQKASLKPQMQGQNIKNKTLNKIKPSNQSTLKDTQGEYLNSLGQLSEAQRRALLLNLQKGEANHALIQQKMMLNSNPFLKNQFEMMQQAQQRNISQKNKLFGRSTYHVAIAYHIHLRQKQQLGVDMTKQKSLDPTYPAKRLKQVRVNQQRPRSGQETSTP